MAERDKWTLPVSTEEVTRARDGDLSVFATPTRVVPPEWYGGGVAGEDVLCLASGGGQQAPLFAAAGARVTSLDNSPAQLARDREVAEREHLELRTELGVMADLSRFDDASFDLVFHPVSNVFAPEIRPVWRECFRVLRSGGTLIAGFVNPWWYVFDDESMSRGEFVVRHSLPYSCVDSLTPQELKARVEAERPLEYAHSLEDQIGGQLDAGFLLAGYLDDVFPGEALEKIAPQFSATRAIKP